MARYNKDDIITDKEIIATKKKKSQNKTVKIFLDLTICILLIIFVFCGYQVISWIIENHNTSSIIEELGLPSGGNISLASTLPVVSRTDSGTALTSNTESSASIPEWQAIGANIAELKKINGDTVAWIKVNGLNKLNYPVVRASDNDFYLTHDYYKKYTKAGWVFADFRNTENAESLNFIIYAHARADKSMFGSLKIMWEKSWYENQNNHFVYITTANDELLYQIFSVYYTEAERDDGFSYIRTDFSTKSEYREFLRTIINLNELPAVNYSANPSDNIITLSTCKGSDDTMRLVVHAKLIGSKNDPTLESYKALYNTLSD